jgi:hypothetical protein
MRKDITPRDMLMDRRVVDRNIHKGNVTREEFEKHLQSLPDVADQAVTVRARLGEDAPEEVLEEEDDAEG